MIKTFLVVASLLLTGTNAVAFDNNRLYLGIGVKSGSGKLTLIADSSGSASASGSYDSSSIPLKIGYILNSDDRVELSIDSMDYKFNGGTDTVSGLNLDWDFTFPNNKLGNVVIPYLTIGFGSYTYEDTAKYFVLNEDLVGFAINYGFGGLYNINKNLELEGSFKAKTIKWQDVKIEDITIESDSFSTALYLGLNYRF